MKKVSVKGQSIIETVVVALIFGIIFRWLAFYTRDLGFGAIARNIFYMLWAITIPIILIWVTKLEIGLKNWKFAIHIGFLIFWLGFIQSIGFATVGALKLKFSSWPAFGILVFVVLVMTGIALLIYNKVDEEKTYRYSWKLAFFGALFLVPPIVVGLAGKSVGITLFDQLYFTFGVGIAEELMYRGYIQTRINGEFGRPWRIGKTQFGPGLIISSVLFGLCHMYNLGSKDPNLIFALAAIFMGFFFGFARERGGIWVAIAFHVLWSAIPEPIMRAFGII
ncbi:MAG: CPBP family intramembrane metalloprotease [Bacteroidales bacterium]|nr:MAG: CPBP family intramembrane metalloprotease [Bacteroidales bacterium]